MRIIAHRKAYPVCACKSSAIHMNEWLFCGPDTIRLPIPKLKFHSRYHTLSLWSGGSNYTAIE